MEKQELLEENIQLKKALALCLNKSLIKRLLSSLESIEKGDFISEEEFFRNYQELIA